MAIFALHHFGFLLPQSKQTYKKAMNMSDSGFIAAGITLVKMEVKEVLNSIYPLNYCNQIDWNIENIVLIILILLFLLILCLYRRR